MGSDVPSIFFSIFLFLSLSLSSYHIVHFLSRKFLSPPDTIASHSPLRITSAFLDLLLFFIYFGQFQAVWPRPLSLSYMMILYIPRYKYVIRMLGACVFTHSTIRLSGQALHSAHSHTHTSHTLHIAVDRTIPSSLAGRVCIFIAIIRCIIHSTIVFYIYKASIVNECIEAGNGVNEAVS